jgi:hypothetical protein
MRGLVLHYRELIVLLALSNVVLFGGMATFFVLWIRARDRELRSLLAAKQKPERGAELEQLMTAVDSIAVEVERISEAQRFTTKVLLDRDGAAKRMSAGVPERIITPH